MRKYKYYQKDKKLDMLTKEELANVEWTKYKIIVPTNKDKKELMQAFEHIHFSDINTDFIPVNQLAHEYLDGSNIVVDKKLFNTLK